MFKTSFPFLQYEAKLQYEQTSHFFIYVLNSKQNNQTYLKMNKNRCNTLNISNILPFVSSELYQIPCQIFVQNYPRNCQNPFFLYLHTIKVFVLQKYEHVLLVFHITHIQVLFVTLFMFIPCFFREMRCLRNKIHINLFLTFIFTNSWWFASIIIQVWIQKNVQSKRIWHILNF